MPEGKRIGAFRSDSAAYQASIFNYCDHKDEDKRIDFAVGADLDSAVLGVIRAIPAEEWRPYYDGGRKGRERKDNERKDYGHIAETVHCMEETKKAFRLVVLRRPIQGELFDEESPKVRYKVIASNRDESAEDTIAWYNARGEHSENRIKELKIGLGMERMPCGQFGANAMFFRIGVLAYNLFRMFELEILPTDWHRHQLRTVRWRLYQVAGKVVRHAGQLYLKVREAYYELFAMIRRRIRIYTMA